ncbi:DNA-3-methyladenine glycosylase 2 family protein [Pseudobdellovibrio exovorus]|uniref:DNA-3-methyladenine glycosylase II n=1 Tax=Pseudobdellovibrio exovorus JSS TaxID=1184267 RepID=M4V5U6_9BACT|nr:AlkA N-terminal domain-containing protein [Pseudobdellovibrio exovorus]AGH94543.1 hypothetical protein A11Q_323 [Pseudobdellovibrio exovorus JSS]
MKAKSDIYYSAMIARDPRFDGKFFIGVKTTGIYCRPICPAKPKKENIEYFHSHIEAEKAGYRPCLRCRPESAPLSPAWVGKSAVVQRAVKVLNSQDTIEFSEDQFAVQFGVSARHLRRLFIEEIGKTPKQLSFENRLNLARKLITETVLPMSEVAYAAGFSSVRRFNDAFKDRFKKSPREIRRVPILDDEGLSITIPYRPPFDFSGLMQSYQSHRIGQLEWFTDGQMHRVIEFNGKVGQISIRNDEKKSHLVVKIQFPDTSVMHTLISRVRNLFDLDSDPALIANALESDSQVKKLLKTCPGIRMPSGWSPFEVAIATILGQLVSLEQARSLVSQLIEIAGQETQYQINGQRIKLFPTPQQIVKADLSKLKTTGLRKQTLVDFSKAILSGEISLEPTQDVEEFKKKVMTIKGIGLWTAQYMSMKVLRDTDSFPASDLILKRALEIHSSEVIAAMAPWRGYVAALFWRVYAQELKKTKKVKGSST